MTIVKSMPRDMTADDMKAEFARETGIKWLEYGDQMTGKELPAMMNFILTKLAEGRLIGDD